MVAVVAVALAVVAVAVVVKARRFVLVADALQPLEVLVEDAVLGQQTPHLIDRIVSERNQTFPSLLSLQFFQFLQSKANQRPAMNDIDRDRAD